MPAAMSLSHQGRSMPERARTPRAALAETLWPQHHILRPPPDLQSSPMSAVAILKHKTAAWTPLILGQSWYRNSCGAAPAGKAENLGHFLLLPALRPDAQAMHASVLHSMVRSLDVA